MSHRNHSRDIEGGDGPDGKPAHFKLTFATAAMTAKFIAYNVIHSRQDNNTGNQCVQLRILQCKPSFDMKFSPDGKWLVSAGGKWISIFSVKEDVSRSVLHTMLI